MAWCILTQCVLYYMRNKTLLLGTSLYKPYCSEVHFLNQHFPQIWPAMCNALCFFHNVWGIVYFWVYSEQKKKNFTVLLSVKRICHCCSNRHLGQSLTQNIRSSQSPGHGSHPCWMSWQNMDKGNLLLPSSTSTSEKCWPGLWFPWIICCNSGYSQLCYCDATHSFDQRPPSGSQWYL